MHCINEELISQHADSQSFERGKNYFANDAIVEPYKQGPLLGGFCRGSRHELYKVEVLLDEKNFRKVSCTCPRGGFCKHIVALLLTYMHEPEEFFDLEDLGDKLANTGKEELIKLIMEMIKRNNSLIGMVERHVSFVNTADVDLEDLRRQIQRLLRFEDISYIEDNLQDFIIKAGDRTNNNDWLTAGVIYAGILDALASVYDVELLQYDYDRDLCSLSNVCVEGLDSCLTESSSQNAKRMEWIEAMLEAGLVDIGLGGIGFADEAFSIILQHATSGEWGAIEKRIRDAIPDNDRWSQGYLTDVLAARYLNLGKEKEAAAIIYEKGTNEQKVLQMVREGKFEKAVQTAKKQFADLPGIIIRLADFLKAFGASAHAVNLLKELINKKKGFRHESYMEWLVEYHLETGNLEEALNWQWKLFELRPGKDNYASLKEIGTKLNKWEPLKHQAIELLEKKENVAYYMEIAIYETDWDKALELLPRIKYSGWTDYRQIVAEGIEKDRPGDAILLYKEITGSFINLRKRNTYREAARFLRRIKKLYKQLGQNEKWEEYITGIKRKYARYPALQDELKQAKL